MAGLEREAVTSWLKGLLASLHDPGSPEASVALYLPQEGGMTKYAVGGEGAEALFETHIPNDLGPYHFSLTEREPLYLPDAQEEDRVMECYLDSFAEVIAPVSTAADSTPTDSTPSGSTPAPPEHDGADGADRGDGAADAGRPDRGANRSDGAGDEAGSEQSAGGLLVARRRGPSSFQPDEVSAVIAWAKKFPG